MKRITQKCAGVLLSLSIVFSASAAAAPVASAAESNYIQLTYNGGTDFSGRRDILDEYVCSDGSAVRIINNKTVYRYSVADDTYTAEFTFPEQEQSKTGVGQSGTLYIRYNVMSAYINRDTGKLYFAQDKYYAFNKPEGMVVEVFTYDLEQGRLLSSFEVTGENVSSVGADNNGNVFLGVRKQVSEMQNKTGLRVFTASGELRASIDTTDYIDTFAGFLPDGSFYFSETELVFTGENNYYVTRYLHKGGFDGSAVTLSENNMTRLSYYYGRPAAITGDDMLALYDGEVYDTATDALVYNYDIGAAVNDDYCAGHNGAAVCYSSGFAYVMTEPKMIKRYDPETGSVVSIYNSDESVFNFIPAGDGFALMLKGESGFRIKLIAEEDFAETSETVLNLNELAVYQRTQADIVKKLAQMMPHDYSEPFFSTMGSASAPYSEYLLTDNTKENIVSAANYFRWLEGLSGFASSTDDVWVRGAKGAVLTQRNVELTGSLSHYPNRPDDMDEAFFTEARRATETSNISYGYGTGQAAIPELLRGFINDEGYTTIPGHRDTFFTRNGVSFAAGYAPLGAVNTVEYTGSPNPQGNSVAGNNEPAYAWPAPGVFPEEEIMPGCLWTVNLNTDYVNTATGMPVVTITDLQTGEQTVRDSKENGLHTTGSWGKFISFMPPETNSYIGKAYKVEITNLRDGNGVPCRMEYTINFFCYSDEVEIDGKTYTCDAYGNLSIKQPDYLLGDVNNDGVVNIQDATTLQRYFAEYTNIGTVNLAVADVNRDGKINIRDVTQIQRFVAGFITAF